MAMMFDVVSHPWLAVIGLVCVAGQLMWWEAVKFADERDSEHWKQIKEERTAYESCK
jgi:hypothetical protein